MKHYEVHEIANIYPMMNDKEYKGLLNSLEEDGFDIDNPIYLFENKILDGRNRYKACLELDIKPIFKVFKGSFDDAINKSRLLNSSRRQLDKSQRAMIAAFEIDKTRNDINLKKLSIPRAKLIYAVSKRYIDDAISLLKKNKDLALMVFEGKCSIGQAFYKLQEIENIFTVNDEDISTDGIHIEIDDSSHQISSLISENEAVYLDEIQDLQNRLRLCQQERDKLLNDSLD